jgi:hypothetical protein
MTEALARLAGFTDGTLCELIERNADLDRLDLLEPMASRLPYARASGPIDARLPESAASGAEWARSREALAGLVPASVLGVADRFRTQAARARMAASVCSHPYCSTVQHAPT